MCVVCEKKAVYISLIHHHLPLSFSLSLQRNIIFKTHTIIIKVYTLDGDASKINSNLNSFSLSLTSVHPAYSYQRRIEMVVFTAAIVALLTGATVGVPAGGVALALSRVIFLKGSGENENEIGESERTESE